MDPNELHRLLSQLHEELQKAGSLDAQSRAMLGTLVEDIRAVSATSGADATHAPALERLAVRFEADHPALAAALRQLVDALGKAGI